MHIMSLCLIIDDNFDHLVKLVSARFLHCKGIFPLFFFFFLFHSWPCDVGSFSFVIKKHLWDDTFKILGLFSSTTFYPVTLASIDDPCLNLLLH